MSKRSIAKKNYVILFGVIVLIICACFATYNLYNAYQENRINQSPLAIKEVLYEDLKNATTEIDADTFLVISYTQDSEVHKNENAIKKVLMRKNLIDNVMYLDITEYRNNKETVQELNGTLKLNDSLKIKKFPAVVYYKEGFPTKMIDSSDHVLNSDDFEQIIDMYDLAS